MVIKTTLLATLTALSLATTPLQAGENPRRDAFASPAASQPAPMASDILVTRPAPDVPGDVLAGRGPNPHARELRDIAIYNSIDNQDGVAMLSAQLHQFGVSRQTIQRAIDQTNVHATSPAHSGVRASQDHAETHADAGWQASQ